MGFSEATFSRQDPGVKDKIMQLVGAERMLEDLLPQMKALETAQKETERRLRVVETERDAAVARFREIESEAEATAARSQRLEADLQAAEAALKAAETRLQAADDAAQGRNALTRALGDGKTVTLLAISLAVFEFFALWRLMTPLMGKWEAFVPSLVAPLFLLVFTVRGNATARAICVVISFALTGLYSFTRYTEIGQPQVHHVVGAFFFALLVPTLMYLVTEEMKEVN